MSMEFFVSCVGDLATFGGLVVDVTLVRSPPGYSFLSARPLPLGSFTLVARLPCGRDVFFRGEEVSKTHEGNASVRAQPRLERKCIAGVWFTVYRLMI